MHKDKSLQHRDNCCYLFKIKTILSVISHLHESLSENYVLGSIPNLPTVTHDIPHGQKLKQHASTKHYELEITMERLMTSLRHVAQIDATLLHGCVYTRKLIFLKIQKGGTPHMQQDALSSSIH